MRIFDLIKPGVACCIHHPQVGYVKWKSVDTYFMLYFAEGPEEGEPLVADESVLLDDTWEVFRKEFEPYKGYTLEYTMLDDGSYQGTVKGIKDVVTCEGNYLPDLAKAFHDSVDDYLAFCQDRNEPPNAPN